jgi:hypothetical protein
LFNYLELMIHGKRMQQTADRHRKTVVAGLERLATRHRNQVDPFKKNASKSNTGIKNTLKTSESTKKQIKNIFNLV